MFVRTYIVPAAMKLLGRWNWWAPGRLQRMRREEKVARAATAAALESRQI
jgi:RND superfamily putative drug exporter